MRRYMSGKYKTILVILFMACKGFAFAQTVLFHEYEMTASSWSLLRWNVDDTTGVKNILRETVDAQGRVSSLEFLKNGKIFTDKICYLPEKVEYEYTDSTITELLYSDGALMYQNDCEMWFKTVYHLDSNNFVFEKEVFSRKDTSEMSPDKTRWLDENLPEYQLEELSPESYFFVTYYYYSWAKLNGLMPVSVTYDPSAFDVYDSEIPAWNKVIEGIEKLRQQAEMK
ncbi:MAG TPA: hypothetical protein PKY63_07710 [Bacteroidales bacterium]|nr:hypothetical protein [Bacteroidales bacterium]